MWDFIMMHRAKHTIRVATTPNQNQTAKVQKDIENAINMLNLFNRPDNHRVDLQQSTASNSNVKDAEVLRSKIKPS